MKIITLTLSPAVDLEYHAATVNPEGLNRTREHRISAGGKGINVSRSILRCAEKKGIPAELKTVAPIGGETGELFRRILAAEGMTITAVPIVENTRVNVSLIPDEGHSVEINAPGTPVGDALSEIENAVLGDLESGDVVVIAGSCPKDVPADYPSQLVGKVKEKGAFAVLDCDGKALEFAVQAEVRPDLIKPNLEELEGLLGRKMRGMEELKAAVNSLNIPTVITTMAGDGAAITENGETAVFPTVKRPVVRLKGAGDTFLGAFVYAKYVLLESSGDAMLFAGETAGEYVAGE